MPAPREVSIGGMTALGTVRAPRTSRFLLRLAITSLVLAGAMTALGPASHPPAVQAGTAEYMEGLLVKWINAARTNRGVPALRVGSKLTTFAGERAKTMASTNKLAHPSCLACMLRQKGVSFSSCGEVIASTSYPWGYDAARSIYRAWRGSSGHWSILMSRSYTRLGIGVAYRSSTRSTFAAGVLVR
jgi:uncharacterized protein YkwD